MNILITGAGGQLGHEFHQHASFIEDHCVFTDIAPTDFDTEILDITNLDDVREKVKAHQIDVIINCAAYTNVDGAETDAERCELINHHAVRNLAIAMKEVGGYLIHISTDYVFGGDPYNTPCREDQKGTPTGVYGATKLRGEQAILEEGCHYLIFRTSWLYSPYGKNFLKTMLHLTQTKEEVKVVFDQVGTPTYAADLARVILYVIAKGMLEGNDGIYHYSNEGVASWFDFAYAIADYAGHLDCEVRPCHSDEFPSPVQRPAYSVLDKSKVKDTFGVYIPYWKDALFECMTQMDAIQDIPVQ